jgi:mannosyl-oligosaccharide alpha-1,3-glucosidase
MLLTTRTLLWLSFFVLPAVFAVKSQDFKTCSEAGFCRRGRALASRSDEAGSSWKSPYSVDPASIVTDVASLSAAVKSSLYPDIKFSLEVRIHDDDVARIRMDEVDGLRKRYDEAAAWTLVEDPSLGQVEWVQGKKDIRAQFGGKKQLELRVSYDPLKITLLRNGKDEIILNGGGLLHMEHFRVKEETPEAETNDSTIPGQTEEEEATDTETQQVLQVNPRAWFEGDDQDTWWSEQFRTWRDSKPKGADVMLFYIRMQ